jgi:hypothetical protein
MVLGFLFYKVYKFVNGIDHADLEYNTIYTKKYQERLFNDNLLGLTEKEIIKIFGQPFSKTKPGYFDAILYTNYKDSVSFEQYSHGLALATLSEKMKYRFISFDSLGHVDDMMIQGYPDSANQIKLLTKPEIVKKFGKPAKEILCNCNCEVYAYSRIKRGEYSGKHPTINQRNIIFNSSHIAIKIIKKAGNSYSTTDGTCDEQ